MPSFDCLLFVLWRDRFRGERVVAFCRAADNLGVRPVNVGVACVGLGLMIDCCKLDMSVGEVIIRSDWGK